MDEFYKNIPKPTHAFYNDNNPTNEPIKTTQYFFKFGVYTKKQQKNNKYTKKWFREKYTDPKHPDFKANNNDDDDDDDDVLQGITTAGGGLDNFTFDDDDYDFDNDNSNVRETPKKTLQSIFNTKDKFIVQYGQFRRQYDDITIRNLTLNQLNTCLRDCEWYISMMEEIKKQFVAIELV